MEPTLNLFKSLIVIVTCVFGIVSAANRLAAGGNPAAYGLAVIYGAVATVGCFTVAWIMHRRRRDFHSDLVVVDVRTWFVDGLLSGSVMVGFAGAWWLAQSPWPQYAPLVDPILLMALGIAVLPIPGKIMLDSLREVIHIAPLTCWSRKLSGDCSIR